MPSHSVSDVVRKGGVSACEELIKAGKGSGTYTNPFTGRKIDRKGGRFKEYVGECHKLMADKTKKQAKPKQKPKPKQKQAKSSEQSKKERRRKELIGKTPDLYSEEVEAIIDHCRSSQIPIAEYIRSVADPEAFGSQMLELIADSTGKTHKKIVVVGEGSHFAAILMDWKDEGLDAHYFEPMTHAYGPIHKRLRTAVMATTIDGANLQTHILGVQKYGGPCGAFSADIACHLSTGQDLTKRAVQKRFEKGAEKRMLANYKWLAENYYK